MTDLEIKVRDLTEEVAAQLRAINKLETLLQAFARHILIITDGDI